MTERQIQLGQFFKSDFFFYDQYDLQQIKVRSNLLVLLGCDVKKNTFGKK